MDAGFSDSRGRLVWSLPDEAAQLLANANQEQRSQVMGLFNQSLGVLCFLMLRSFTNPRLAQHLEGVVNIMTDLITAAEVQQQQAAQQGGQGQQSAAAAAQQPAQQNQWG